MYQVPDGLPTLSREAHNPASGRACVMEYISVIAGEDWSDHPHCTDALIGQVAICINDVIEDQNLRGAVLVPRIGRLIGTSIPFGWDNRKRWRYRSALAEAVREIAPVFYDHRVNNSVSRCDCVEQCLTDDERRLHSVVQYTSNFVMSDPVHRETAVQDLTRALDGMLGIADRWLDRTRRDTETAEKLMTLVHELVSR